MLSLQACRPELDAQTPWVNVLLDGIQLGRYRQAAWDSLASPLILLGKYQASKQPCCKQQGDIA